MSALRSINYGLSRHSGFQYLFSVLNFRFYAVHEFHPLFFGPDVFWGELRFSSNTGNGTGKGPVRTGIDMHAALLAGRYPAEIFSETYAIIQQSVR